MIVKLQISLGSSDGRTRALIYNEERTVLTEMEPGQDILDVMGDDAKAYFTAVLHENGMLQIKERVPEQAW